MSIRNQVYIGPYVEISSPIQLDFSEITEEHFLNVTDMVVGREPNSVYLIPNLSYPKRQFNIDPESYCGSPISISGPEIIESEVNWVVNKLEPYAKDLGKKYEAHPDFDPANTGLYSGNVLWGILIYAI